MAATPPGTFRALLLITRLGMRRKFNRMCAPIAAGGRTGTARKQTASWFFRGLMTSLMALVALIISNIFISRISDRVDPYKAGRVVISAYAMQNLHREQQNMDSFEERFRSGKIDETEILRRREGFQQFVRNTMKEDVASWRSNIPKHLQDSETEKRIKQYQEKGEVGFYAPPEKDSNSIRDLLPGL